jgi:transcriptional regulator with XRE-family HTH domain
METHQVPGDRIKLLVEKLGLPTMAEFCRRTGLNRGLVDRLTAGAHSPRYDSLQKIKAAFPEVNMNWLVSGESPVLQSAPDEDETFLLEMYREHVKGGRSLGLTMAFRSSVRWFAKENQERDELDLNAKAISLSEEECERFQASLLLAQYQRRLTSELQLRSKKEGTTLLTEGIQSNRLRKRINQLEETIQKTINQPLEL